MTTVCGVELKGHEAIFTIVEKKDDGGFVVKPIDTKKIALKDSESRESIKEFKEQINNFIADNNVETVCIKKRSKKGEFSGGADTFIMEAMIQDSDAKDVKLVSPQAVSAYQKKNNIVAPDELNKYQHNAYLTAVTGANK
ncbi:DUF3010 family protein [Billgrantia endophytica]|uniref:DUF3010 domain-containing protein n=1 Tax=Billgrantia endophytica TaxID=2033802 RepID=A0A2N7U0U5_9GAMM|nr:DUF3010 family protein [Halomonas endophytica]PMR74058.1 DUF3010 domain-containing protein [Halomonas endophytica]